MFGDNRSAAAVAKRRMLRKNGFAKGMIKDTSLRKGKEMELISQSSAQQIVDTVHDVCRQNINFIDERGIIIASSDKSRIGSYHEIGHRAFLEGKTIEVSDDDEFTGTRQGINIPVFYNDKAAAVIGISGRVSEIRRYARLSQRITQILLKEREIEALGYQKKSRQNYVIRGLINGEDLDERYIKETLKENSLSAASLCRVVLVKINAPDEAGDLFMIHSAVTRAFQQMGQSFYRYHYPDEYLMIMESRQLSSCRPVLSRLSEDYRQVVLIGIGKESPLLQCRQSYLCAKASIACAGPGQNPVLYDELDYELLLNAVDATFREPYCRKVLGKLSEADRRLLTAYFDNDMSLQAAGEALFIHKNTLQYQLNRIAGISGYNPRKFHDAVILYSALKACALNSPGTENKSSGKS